MFNLMRSAGRFEEDRAKFYILQIILGLDFLHKNKYVYRDLKPENVLMDADGYICLSDFELAIKLDSKHQTPNRGAADYCAPEIINGNSPTFDADFWSVGILTYEMIVGFPPFYTGNSQNTAMFENIKEKEVYLDVKKHGIEMSAECTDFIQKLLQKDPTQRLGNKGGVSELI
jgi:serine/threonine protein kinase